VTPSKTKSPAAATPSAAAADDTVASSSSSTSSAGYESADEEERHSKHHHHHHHSIAGQSRMFTNVATLLEAALFVSSLIATADLSVAGAASAAADKDLAARTGAEYFLQSLVGKVSQSAFWLSIAVYLGLFVLLPVLVGVLLARSPRAQSVFGQSVTRIATLYLVQPQFGAFVAKHLLPHFSVPLFNVINAVSLLWAFWEHIEVSASQHQHE
jgi:hypothetical protein